MATLIPLNYRADSPDNLTASEVDHNFSLIAQAIAELQDTLAAGGSGGPGGGSGVTQFVQLTDKATADIPSINGPTGNALAGKLPNSHAGSGGGAHAAAVASGANGFLTGSDKAKLDSVASGATANASDSALLARSNHTGTQPAATISDFTESAQDVIGGMIAAAGGSYDDSAGSITLPSGGATSITVQDEGSPLATGATAINFVGAGVTASGTGATKTVTIPGAPAATAITVQDEGTSLATAADTLNFVGAGVTASGSGAAKTITIPGGSGPANTDALPEGSTNRYFTEARVRATVLTGLDTATTGAAAATDSVLAAIGKLQATKATANAVVDVSAVATLTAAAHCDRHLFSTSDAVTGRALPATGMVAGQYIEYSNHGALPHAFTGPSAAPGLAVICNPNETIQFVYSAGAWYAVTPVNPSIVPLAATHAANYTTVLSDAGRRVPHPVGDEVVRTFTINGALAYIDGTVITFPNRTVAALQVALSGGSGTMRLAGTGSTGPRTVPGHSYCTAMLDGGDWLVSGPGVT